MNRLISNTVPLIASVGAPRLSPVCLLGNCGLLNRRTFSGSPSTREVPARSAQSDVATRKPVETIARKQAPVKEYEEIPGPKPWPIVGNTFQVYSRTDFDTKQIHRVWSGLLKEYGPLVKLSLIGMPDLVATFNPDDAEIFLKATMNNPIRFVFRSLKKVRDNEPNNYFDKKSGLLPENGEEWWRLRSRVQGALLKPRNVSMYLPKVDKATMIFMDRIDSLQQQLGRVPDDFLQELYKWALECVGVVALDKELGCLEPDLADDSVPMQLIRNINDMFSALNETEMGLPSWTLFRSRAYVKLETAHAAFLEVADKSIKEACLNLEEAASSGNPKRTLTVIETLLNTDGLSKSDVVTMILDMLLAGVDTTSHTIAFTLYLLATNPDSQRKLQEEVDRVLGDSKELLPEHISAMTYLVGVVKESLRMYPLTIGNSRVLTEDVVISGYKVPAGVSDNSSRTLNDVPAGVSDNSSRTLNDVPAGVSDNSSRTLNDVPAGKLVFSVNMLICRDEKYFPQTDTFIPERWNRDRPLGPIHPYASMPFSHGKRMCIGKRIAEQEIYAFLIRAMQKYSVLWASTEEMQSVTQLVLKPAVALSFQFHKRK